MNATNKQLYVNKTTYMGERRLENRHCQLFSSSFSPYQFREDDGALDAREVTFQQLFHLLERNLRSFHLRNE